MGNFGSSHRGPPRKKLCPELRDAPERLPFVLLPWGSHCAGQAGRQGNPESRHPLRFAEMPQGLVMMSLASSSRLSGSKSWLQDYMSYVLICIKCLKQHLHREVCVGMCVLTLTLHFCEFPVRAVEVLPAFRANSPSYPAFVCSPWKRVIPPDP